jgi:hypothetical protein
VVGGFAVIHEWPGGPAKPAHTADEVTGIVHGEIAAGRVKVIAFGAGIPAMSIRGIWYSPGLIDVIDPGGGPRFQSSTPVAAWVVVLGGQGVDGDYNAIGVIEDATGRPLVTVVFTPGAG